MSFFNLSCFFKLQFVSNYNLLLSKIWSKCYATLRLKTKIIRTDGVDKPTIIEPFEISNLNWKHVDGCLPKNDDHFITKSFMQHVREHALGPIRFFFFFCFIKAHKTCLWDSVVPNLYVHTVITFFTPPRFEILRYIFLYITERNLML